MKSALYAALLGFGASAVSALQQKCSNNICYSLSIPASTVSSGTGDIYMQITGPTSYAWIGLGQGNQMAGAQMFIIYTSSSGNNVTLSPRLGVGNVMPRYNSNAQVTLLEGSGVSNGMMTANIKCSSCQSWSGGSMDPKASSTSWIHAANSGSALNSDSTSATIQQHQNIYGTMGFDSSAQGGSSLNPFLAASSTSSGSTNGSSTAAGASSSSSGSSDSDMGGGEPASRSRMIIAHGVLACLAWVIFFPLGAIAIRLFSFNGLVWFHAGCQAFAFIVFIAAFGLGVKIASDEGELGVYHPVIGIVVFCLVAIQPVLGTIHHAAFKKYQKRTVTSHAHVWLGRILITLGIINGGLGLRLSANTTKGEIAYGVIAGVIWLVYVASIVVGEMKRKKNVGSQGTPSKWEHQSGQSSPPIETQEARF